MSKPKFINELSIPAVAAPMFLISGPELVIDAVKMNSWNSSFKSTNI